MTDRGVPVVRSAILSHYAALAVSMNVDVVAMLDLCRIDRQCLVNPDIPVPIERAADLVASSARAAQCDTFGIRMALARGTPDLGPLNLLLREEPHLRAALRSLKGFFRVHSDGISFEVEEADDMALLRVSLDSASPPQAMEMVVCGMLQTLCWLTGEPPDEFTVCFAHPGPADMSEHRGLLGCAVQFEAGIDGVLFPGAQLVRPIPQANPGLRRHAEDYVRALSDQVAERFEARVRHLVVALLPGGRCSADAVAAQLGIDRTTMARRLAKTGDSFEAIVLETRRNAALRACRTDMALGVIAERLGYADLSSFSRWFARTFGCPPSKWRAHTGQSSASAHAAIR